VPFIIIIVLVIIAIICCPIAAIWALNTLFGLAIPLTFKTWLAAAVLSATVYGPGGSRK